jgi:hypothetical protein
MNEQELREHLQRVHDITPSNEPLPALEQEHRWAGLRDSKAGILFHKHEDGETIYGHFPWSGSHVEGVEPVFGYREKPQLTRTTHQEQEEEGGDEGPLGLGAQPHYPKGGKT